MEYQHEPVLLNEVIEYLEPHSGRLYIDCTVGGGGHAAALLQASEGAKVIGIDKDMDAISHVRQELAGYGERFQAIHGDYKDLKALLARNRVLEKPSGLLYDLGVSSWQLDEPERGFSYHEEARLDMRMNQSQGLSAYEIVNNWSQQELSRIMYEYGEERWAKRIAKFICQQREEKPIATTLDLVDVIKRAIPSGARATGPHPARRTFQAIRIAVNGELDNLEEALKEGVDVLETGGRIAVISFHSLEDRIVKKTFRYLQKDCVCPPGFPECVCDKEQKVQVITRKPVTASAAELKVNHRARSAKLRVAERV
ncbi:MAG: 16S rRNA (cytosine(1402)-N(4))-methyltransferase RsmH [Halanaerobium sp.]|nr:16S rRNA (cytosine(1402)-N(4))-methyltransferase RsmH [Halanaerobium sp.]